ncbi:MAG: hypothetical protein HYV97_07975 [Bdellovibrio sp.]|nr:hypothetical protein [Bdellovibrio sp.]
MKYKFNIVLSLIIIAITVGCLPPHDPAQALNQEAWEAIKTSSSEPWVLYEDDLRNERLDFFEEKKYNTATDNTKGFSLGGLKLTNGQNGNYQVVPGGVDYIAQLSGTLSLSPWLYSPESLTWEDYDFQISMRYYFGTTYFAVYYTGLQGYWVTYNGSTWTLYRQDILTAGATSNNTTLATATYTIPVGIWNDVKVSLKREFSGVRIIVYSGTTALINSLDTKGKIHFGKTLIGLHNGKMDLDNLKISSARLDYSKSWHQVAFQGGWSNAVTAHPTLPNVAFMGGTDGGLFKTEDYGNTWKEIGIPGELHKIRVRAISISSKNPDIIYVGTVGKHVSPLWRSDNGGKTWKWTSAGNISLEGEIFAVAIDPENPYHIFSGMDQWPTKDGIWESYNGGKTFTTTLPITHNKIMKNGVAITGTNGSGNGGGNISVIRIDPVKTNSGVHLVAGTRTNKGWHTVAPASTPIIRSFDGGKTWVDLSEGLPTGQDITDIQFFYPDSKVHPSTNYNSYSLAQLSYSKVPLIIAITAAQAIYVLPNDLQSTTWKKLSATAFNGLFLKTVRIDEFSSPKKVLVIGHKCIVEGDGFLNWTKRGTCNHATIDHGYSDISPANPNVIYSNSYGYGTKVSLNGGHDIKNSAGVAVSSFESRNNGLKISAVRAVVIAPSDNNIVYTVAEGGLYKSIDAGENWSWAGLYGTDYNAIAVHPTDPDTFIVGGGRWASTRLYYYQAGTVQPVDLSKKAPFYSSITSLAFHPTTPTTLFAGAGEGPQGACYYGVPNSGQANVVTWAANNLESNSLKTSIVDAKNRNVAQEVVNSASLPKNPCWGTGLWKSDDSGQTWYRIPSVPMNVVSAIEIHPAQTNIVVVTTLGSGVYVSTDSGNTFSAMNGTACTLNYQSCINPSLKFTTTNGTTTSTAVGIFTQALALHPQNPQIMYAGTASHYGQVEGTNANGLYKTENGGATWTRLLNGLNNYNKYLGGAYDKSYTYNTEYKHIGFGGGVDSIVIDPKFPERVFVGLHDPGVLVTHDGGNNWRWAQNGYVPLLSHTYPYRLAFASGGEYLLATTCGRGIFKNFVNKQEVCQNCFTIALTEIGDTLIDFANLILDGSEVNFTTSSSTATEIPKEDFLQTTDNYESNILSTQGTR